ncbi:MAG: ABC transporter permease [Chitinophagaceae bacterium]|nr:ABC transporter permease [Chitinophagaceae bacterium]MDP1763607.1 ABC transporter permease [Sediminibacterium sp.]MDP1811354.1 ABC transporter permease [Sediminibacterium sp.]MDP3128089.1 ABC transporter permease [Sediminibacterium sp.]MDP3665510.1 ABC transporter permease [Sediminibacterium sp.]
MFKLFGILWNSFRMAMQELRVNKLRTFLSLFGITIGIFCIIGVLATVDSLERKVQNDIKTFGNNTIYIDKWNYGGGPDNPWWKYMKRPPMRIEEMKFVKIKSQLAANVAMFVSNNVNLSYRDNILNNVNMYGVSEEYNIIQTIDIDYGRYLIESEFTRGATTGIIGYKVAEELFGNAERAVGKEVSYSGKRIIVVGVIKKQGQSFVGGFDYDQSLIVSYRYYAGVFNPDKGNPFIMVQGKPTIPSAALADELTGVMRQSRRLSPTAEDNFSCNDVAMFSEQVKGFFGQVSAGGWAIAGLSLIVGAFGVANIMFVTVRERTSQIGLKKALGAKRRTILTEFLIESAFLCIIGGLIGLGLVGLLSLVLSMILPFPIFIAPNIIILALSICIILGIISGIIPASIAARMDPVVAIRTK